MSPVSASNRKAPGPDAAGRPAAGTGSREGEAAIGAVSSEQLMQLMPVAVYNCDAEGRITFYNRRAAELWGREPRLNDGQEKFCAFHKTFLADGTLVPPAATPMAIAVREGRSFRDVEAVAERPDGSKAVISINIDPVRDADGKLNGAISVFQDISNRKRLARRESEKRYREMVQALPGAVCTCDAAGRITLYNDAAALLWGFRPEPGTLLRDIVRCAYRPDGSVLPAEQLPLTRALREGRPLPGEEIIIERSDGTKRTVLAHPVPTRNAAGTITGGINMLIDITEHRRNEEALHRLAAIVESSADAIIGTDLNGMITSWNAGAERLYGYTAGEAISRPVAMLIPPQRHDEEPALLERVRRGEKVDRYETERRRKDGRLLNISLTVSPIKDARGNIAGAAKIAHDITARKAAEQALRESEQRLRMATRTGKIGIWDWDVATNRIAWTDSLYEIHGVKAENFAGTVEGFAALVHPEDAGPVQRAIRSALEHDVPYELEFRAVRPDGRTVWLFTNAVVVREGGRPVRMLGATLDITARKTAEHGLRESEKRFRTLASHAPVGIFLTDPRGETIFVNESWCAMTGLTAAQARGPGWMQAIHPEDRERVASGWREAVKHGGASSAEYRFLRSDGSITWVQGQAVQLRDGAGQLAGYIGTIADFTQRMTAEEKLRESEAQLQAHATELERNVQERTASLREAVVQMEEFSYSVSHDLRAPLRAMNAYAQALAEDYGAQLDETARGYLERIQRSSLRMEKLTHDVLTYSRVARTEVLLAPVDVLTLLRDVIGQYAELQPPAAELEIGTPLPPVLAHESSLGQCLANLLTNATKFVAPGVRPRIRVRGEQVGERVRIWIEDNGIGVEPRYQANLFRVFERVPTRHPYDGTGIGLALVRKAVEKMGGSCGVESDGHNGSRFWIEVPKA